MQGIEGATSVQPANEAPGTATSAVTRGDETGGPARPPAIALTGIVKRFPGVVANDRVTFSVAAGRVHALVGENGAGKSTLMKILYGVQRPDAGTIAIDGAGCTFRSPADAIAAGIGMVFQHFMLADNLTVWENVVLGQEPVLTGRRSTRAPGGGSGGRGSGVRGWAGVLAHDEARRSVADLSTRFGLALDPEAIVGELSVGMRQRVEIVKVLYRGARILILDEPTAVLVPQEVDELFASLRELTDAGNTVIFISHKLDEVLAIADEITVLRAGRTVAAFADTSALSSRQLAEAMIGTDLPVPARPDHGPSDIAVLRVRNLHVTGPDGRTLVEEASLDVHRGEIVGIAGVEGNGQHELLDALMGMHRTTGTIDLGGVGINTLHTAGRRRAGLALIPSDRHTQGLLLSLPLWENALLGHHTRGRFRRGPFIKRKAVREFTTQVVAAFDVRTPGIDIEAHALSGGNQQKLIIGREMAGAPQVLLAAHPTRGIDVGAQALVWEHLRRARADGLGILLLSSDLEELLALSDRLLVMLRGRLVADLDPATITAADLGRHMTGAVA